MANKYLDLTGVDTLWKAVKAEDEKIDAKATNLINDLSFVYDANAKTITLKGNKTTVDGEDSYGLNTTISTADFVKDGMLEDVSIVTSGTDNPIAYEGTTYTDGTKFIKFLWNTDGTSKVDYLKVEEIAKTYVGSDSITINSNNELHVAKVNADITKTTDAITIAGGPLAGYFDDVYTDGVIPAGTTLQDLLQALACTELWPNPAALAAYGTFTSTISAPSSTQSWSGSSKLVEIGAPITVGAVTASNAVSNSPSLTFDNFSYGFATTIGKHNATKVETNPDSVKATVTTVTDGVEYTLSRTYSNFKRADDHSADSVKGALASGISFASETVNANIGKNTVQFTLSVNKQIHSATVKAPSVYYALSNLGNTDDKNGTVQTVDRTETYTYTPNPAIPATKSSSVYEVTAVRPVYHNIASDSFKADADVRFGLQKGATFVITVPTEVNSANNFMFDYPKTHTISNFNVKDLQGNWVPFSAYYNATSETVTKTIQGVDYEYYRLTTGGGNGNGEYQIILNKTLDE